ncbi:hypothetical protein Tco_0786076 [Tanacetum coccineum]
MMIRKVKSMVLTKLKRVSAALFSDEKLAGRLLAERLQEQEREQFTVEERAKFLHDTIAAQRKFLAQQISEAIRDITTYKEQLRNQNEDQFEALFPLAIGSAEEERRSKEMKKKELILLRIKCQGEDKERRRKCLKIVTFEATIDSEIMEKKSVIARLNKVSSPDGYYLVIYRANGNFRAFNYLMKLEDGVVIHMLVERRYPLSKDLLQRMIDLGLEVEREIYVALDLIRFIKQQIDEE